MNEFLLEWFTVYGLPLYFGILIISSAGVPFPVTLMLIVAGSFVEQGEMEFWQTITFGVAGAVIGDNAGYLIGRFGGSVALDKITDKFGGKEKVEKAKEFSNRWGGPGIFFSRWLITPLGPWINLTSGVAKISWLKFAIWDLLGETVWVLVYVILGRMFSDRVQLISDLAGNISWAVIGFIATFILGWKLLKTFKKY